MGRYNTKRTEMKKIASFFSPLCLFILLAYLNNVKLAGCVSRAIRRGAGKNARTAEWKHSMEPLDGQQQSKQSLPSEQSQETPQTKQPQVTDGNTSEGAKKDMTEEDAQNKKGIYSFMSLKFIPYLVYALANPGANQNPTPVEEKHIFNFEKSPTVRYMLMAQERRDNFMYMFFLVVSFVVVILIAIFIFKFFFNL
ncbi:Uncharacterized protein PCOAH_00030610 [Plasmodium coatneyi]|uniref:Apical rhoptry neck protein n=1 Tax=Plasmodium coatneyi TaxID=208452 RepID=A0A1B1E1I5_9APIC|nr:Uncharacterized protein PCOAH_00030610 [Plasmodium coatneyi]ANQ08727.1 Uncharacterized protein PCOAH_00030610 [Plasmodium coatneyi]